MVSALQHNLIHRFNVADSLKRTAARYPLRGISFNGRLWTYPGLDALVNRVARLLLSRGIRRGDNVGIYAINSIEFIAAFFACARIGAALVPVNLLFTPEEADFVLEKTRIKALLVDPGFLPKVKREWPNQITIDDNFRALAATFEPAPVEEYVENEDTVTVIFTSGTTAKPKGVVLTHLNLFGAILNTANIGFDRTLKYLLVLPLFHIAAIAVMNAAVTMGADGVLLPSVKADAILDAIERDGVNMVGFPATVWVGLLQSPRIAGMDLSGIRRCFVFQYLPTPVFERWRELTPNAEWFNLWGQSETTGAGSATEPERLWGWLEKAPDPIGIESLPLEMRIVDELMNDVAPGQMGEIVLRGPAITPGYFEDPQANDALFYGGWHHTGDIAYRDANRSLYFADRKKDMIKTGGENVASLEVEEALSEHPAISEVAVIGLPDPYWIEKVVAAVTLLPGATATSEELTSFARQRLAAFKVPKEIHIVSELPKNPTGKVLKRELRKKFEQASGAAQ